MPAMTSAEYSRVRRSSAAIFDPSCHATQIPTINTPTPTSACMRTAGTALVFISEKTPQLVCWPPDAGASACPHAVAPSLAGVCDGAFGGDANNRKPQDCLSRHGFPIEVANAVAVGLQDVERRAWIAAFRGNHFVVQLEEKVGRLLVEHSVRAPQHCGFVPFHVDLDVRGSAKLRHHLVHGDGGRFREIAFHAVLRNFEISFRERPGVEQTHLARCVAYGCPHNAYAVGALVQFGFDGDHIRRRGRRIHSNSSPAFVRRGEAEYAEMRADIEE